MKNRKYVVVTGASSGIGRETAKAFAQRGRNVVLSGRCRKALEETAEEISRGCPAPTVLIRPADLSSPFCALDLYEDVRCLGLDVWINCAGFGDYAQVARQKMTKLAGMLRVNVEATALLSSLFVRDHLDVPGAQLINVSSAGGYTLVPDAVSYCATKFFVSAFTEGLDWELKALGAKLRAKVFAPAATQTAFGRRAAGMDKYDYDRHFPIHHTPEHAAKLLMQLFDSDRTVGLVDRTTFEFALVDSRFPCAARNSN